MAQSSLDELDEVIALVAKLGDRADPELIEACRRARVQGDLLREELKAVYGPGARDGGPGPG